MCSMKKVFLKRLQNSQEKPCVRVSFFYETLLKFIKKEALAKSLTASFFIEHIRWCPLSIFIFLTS